MCLLAERKEEMPLEMYNQMTGLYVSVGQPLPEPYPAQLADTYINSWATCQFWAMQVIEN